MQAVIVTGLVVIAAGFMAIRIWKTVRPGKKAAGCGKCDKCGG